MVKKESKNNEILLPNRKAFLKDVENGFFNKLVIFDISGFGNINHYYGYDFGEKILKIISVRLQERFENSQMYYLGGDIFVATASEDISKERFIQTIKELIDYEEFCGLKNIGKEIEFKELSGENLKELIDKKEQILLIDVRISTDFQAKNIYNSKNIPFEDLLNRAYEIDETKKVVLICTIGLKSKEAISKLKKAGYKGELYSLKGGITSWINDNQD